MFEYIACDRCDFTSGDLIDGLYTVDKTLGEGTFGRVYRVKDSTNEIFALKLLKLWETPSSERNNLLKRFDMEYETGKIPSNYLVHIYKKSFVKGNPYLLMEYCPCGDLFNAAENNKIDFEIVGREILYGLRDLHKCGKVHRDLKPENVLLRQDGTAVLTDFGIAGDQNKRLTEKGILGVPKQIFGTFAYMPPEQVNPRRGNATVLPTTDIFSFGVMMFQLLTYELPFGNLQSEADLPKYVDNGKKGIWNKTLISINHKEWTDVIEGCLIPDYKSRLQNIDAVLDLMPRSKKRKNLYRSVSSDITKPNLQIGNSILLRVMQGEDYGKVFKLNEYLNNRQIITMGRYDPDIFNVIAITENYSSYISRCHCTLELNCKNKQWIIRDGQWRIKCPIGLKSANPFPCNFCNVCYGKNKQYSWRTSLNGVYVNSEEVDTNGMYIKPGDIISMGDVKLRVERY